MRVMRALVLVFMGAVSIAAASEELPRYAMDCPDEIVWRFRLGPLFERHVTREGGTFTAVRPFYSKTDDPVSGERVDDALWPLATFHRTREQRWWRVLNAFGHRDIQDADQPDWMFCIFPFYTQGETRQGDDYWSLFPFHGYLPHMVLMDDIHYTLFPFYFRYSVNAVERQYYFWPFYSETQEPDNPDVWHSGVFPFYGKTVKRAETNLYAFWPFWVSATYTEPQNSGNAWILFPLMAQIQREKLCQWWILPPFFGYGKSTTSEQWRLPWPFVVLRQENEARSRSFWPFYSDLFDGDHRRYTGGWILFSHEVNSVKGVRSDRLRLFPFYTDEEVYAHDEHTGAEYLREHYLRVWPFFTYLKTPSRSGFRTLELNPVRYSGGIERNWAPFWTIYSRHHDFRKHRIEHDGVWGIINFIVSDDEPSKEGESLP